MTTPDPESWRRTVAALTAVIVMLDDADGLPQTRPPDQVIDRGLFACALVLEALNLHRTESGFVTGWLPGPLTEMLDSPPPDARQPIEIVAAFREGGAVTPSEAPGPISSTNNTQETPGEQTERKDSRSQPVLTLLDGGNSQPLTPHTNNTPDDAA